MRLKKELLKSNVVVSEYRIAKILKKYNLVAKLGRKPTKKQQRPIATQYIEENLIKDKFNVVTPNYLYCADITELKYKGGNKIFVSGIIDVATRRIVGWCISRHQRQDIVQNAFKMAITTNPIRPEGAIFHSDRGCQYTALATKKLIEENNFRKSMSRPGTPSDNQPIESFWKTLKTELPDIRQLRYSEARKTIADYIENYYNARRLHSSINYMSPNNFFTLQCVHFS